MNDTAWVVHRCGNTLTFEWACGHRKTEVLKLVAGGASYPAGDTNTEFMARYWAREHGGVKWECPVCRQTKTK